jgi:hypothetical protein
MRHLTLALFILTAFAPAAAGQAEHRVRDADGLRRAVAAAKPGDRILLAPGEYRGNFHFTNVHGAAGRPVVIAAANPDRPPRFVGDAICLQFSGASHLELCDLVLTGPKGNALNVDDAGNPDRPSHHVRLRNLRVTDIGPRGNSDGIKMSGVDDFLVVDCTVERWGTDGSAVDLVGCHRGVILRCTFRKGGANAVQVKGGSADVVVSRCRFEDAGSRAVNIGGSTGDAFFRPPLKAMPADARYEAKDVRVEGCVFVGGEAAVAFVGVDGAAVRYNTVYRPNRYAVRILQERAEPGFVPCRNGAFENNVVVFRSDRWAEGGVNVGPGTAPETFRFARNLWYCEDRPDESRPRTPTPEADRIIGDDPQFRDPAKGDFGVKPGSPAADRGSHALPAPKGK